MCWRCEVTQVDFYKEKTSSLIQNIILQLESRDFIHLSSKLKSNAHLKCIKYLR